MNPRTVINDWIDAATARRGRQSKGARSGLLLVSSGGLGDTILFSLALPRYLALARPGEPVCLVVREPSLAARFLYPPEVEILAVDYRQFLRNPLYRHRTSKTLQSRRFRVAVSTDHLRLPTVDDVLVMATGAEQRLGLEPRSWPKHDARLAAHRAWYTRWVAASPGLAHRMVRWIELANALIGRDEPLPLVRFADERLPPAATPPVSQVVLHPFSAVPARQHPAGLFVAIAEQVVAHGFEVVLSAAPGDLDRNPAFAALSQRPGVRLDTSPLIEKATRLRAAALVVTVDTSLLHLAVGIGAPTLCLASAAHLIDSVPYDPRMTPDNVSFLYHDMPCRGCLGTCIHPLEDGMYPCVARLDARIVLQRVASHLASA